MEEPDRNAIDEAYFDTICRKLPFLRKLREDQQTMGDNFFALLIRFFKKFTDLDTDLRLEQNPQLRYELLFNIIEIGNLISTMRLVEKCGEQKANATTRYEEDDIEICQGILHTLKRYRNAVADGYHVYSTQVSADLIPTFREFFTALANPQSTQRFSEVRSNFRNSMKNTKKKFKHVNSQDEIFAFISSDGDKENEKLNICTLLEGIKYFLDKAAALYRDDKKDCASLYFIAAANCARDLENYFLVKTRREGIYDVIDPNANIEHYAKDERNRHIKNLLVSMRKLRQDRGQQFAHKVGEQKAITAAAMKKRLSHEQDARTYIAKIYGTIDTFLFKEYGIRSAMARHPGSTRVTDDSPRGYKLLSARHIRNTTSPPPPQRTLFFDSPQKSTRSHEGKREREGKTVKESDVRPGISHKKSRAGD